MTNGRIPANPVGWFETYVAEIDRAKAFFAAAISDVSHSLRWY